MSFPDKGDALKSRDEHNETTRTGFLKRTFFLNLIFFLRMFGDRLWAFAVGIFMHSIGGMVWVAIQQMVDSLAKLFLLPVVGTWLDKRTRNRGMQTVLGFNNLSIAASAFAFYLGLSIMSETLPLMRLIYVVVALVFCAVSRVASEAQKTAFTKDWIVVLIKANKDAARLSTQNAFMTVIDQLAALLAPIVVGVTLLYVSDTTTCLLIIAWNIGSWVIESVVLRYIYQTTPSLHTRSHDEDGDDLEEDEHLDKEPQQKPSFFAPVTSYFRQSCFPAAFGLALLYMTVLGFDNLAISYGTSQGVSPSVLGGFRSAGSAFGLLGATAYTTLERTIGLLPTGFLGLTLQNIFLAFSFVSTFLPGNPFNVTGYLEEFTAEKWIAEVWKSISVEDEVHDLPITPYWELNWSLIFFFCGITLARLGLWIADPTVTQIMQETVPEKERNAIFGVQISICEFFSILKDILVICFPATAMFGVLVYVSCTFVFTGYLFYAYYYITNSCCKKGPGVADKSITDPSGEAQYSSEMSSLLEKGDQDPVIRLNGLPSIDIKKDEADDLRMIDDETARSKL